MFVLIFFATGFTVKLSEFLAKFIIILFFPDKRAGQNSYFFNVNPVKIVLPKKPAKFKLLHFPYAVMEHKLSSKSFSNVSFWYYTTLDGAKLGQVSRTIAYFVPVKLHLYLNSYNSYSYLDLCRFQIHS